MSLEQKKQNEQNPDLTLNEEKDHNIEESQTQPKGELEKLKEQLEEATNQLEALKQEKEQQYDQYLRLAAEYDNYRKRTTKEKENLFDEARAFTIAALLPVLDNLDRVKGVENTTLEDYKKGVEMIIAQLFEILKALGVEEIEALNKPFDPMLHEAVAHIEDENLGENTVVEVLQKGYRIGERVLRHSAVKVAN